MKVQLFTKSFQVSPFLYNPKKWIQDTNKHICKDLLNLRSKTNGLSKNSLTSFTYGLFSVTLEIKTHAFLCLCLAVT